MPAVQMPDEIGGFEPGQCHIEPQRKIIFQLAVLPLAAVRSGDLLFADHRWAANSIGAFVCYGAKIPPLTWSVCPTI